MAEGRGEGRREGRREKCLISRRATVFFFKMLNSPRFSKLQENYLLINLFNVPPFIPTRLEGC